MPYWQYSFNEAEIKPVKKYTRHSVNNTMKKMTIIILILTTTTTALIAGLFYSYSCSVNIGLGRLNDRDYLSAMQSINRAILNPWFFISFIGTLFMLPFSAWFIYDSPPSLAFYFFLAATLVYLFGVFGITVTVNVPLNEALDKIDIANATIEEINTQRVLFEKKWNQFNLIRTIFAVLCLVLSILGCMKSIK